MTHCFQGYFSSQHLGLQDAVSVTDVFTGRLVSWKLKYSTPQGSGEAGMSQLPACLRYHLSTKASVRAWERQ